ncbi:hypothetical protein HMPREF9103_01211 [Lentilactobacillus parafarraginis F0439]|uniref:Uncharacterized protein n=1 Tax=Lentilactobacillus parafarraginis F0439 TaxID=797515 RepID=G9ZNA8_9LACO|nr:hypothetical protein HMPREF9103_01211 [Lentilactobacillus parafarraginis F0439]
MNWRNPIQGVSLSLTAKSQKNMYLHSSKNDLKFDIFLFSPKFREKSANYRRLPK